MTSRVVIETQDKSQKKKTLKESYKEKYYFHKEMCEKCFKDAKQSLDAFPSLDDRDKAEYCFRAGMASLAPGTPFAKVIYGIITMATDVGVDLMKEWNRINTFLLMAEHHADMMGFYGNLLNYFEKDCE